MERRGLLSLCCHRDSLTTDVTAASIPTSVLPDDVLLQKLACCEHLTADKARVQFPANALIA